MSQAELSEYDKSQLVDTLLQWRFSTPAPSGGYITYTVDFAGDQVASVEAFYSAFAGL